MFQEKNGIEGKIRLQVPDRWAGAGRERRAGMAGRAGMGAGAGPDRTGRGERACSYIKRA